MFMIASTGAHNQLPLIMLNMKLSILSRQMVTPGWHGGKSRFEDGLEP